MADACSLLPADTPRPKQTRRETFGGVLTEAFSLPPERREVRILHKFLQHSPVCLPPRQGYFLEKGGRSGLAPDCHQPRSAPFIPSLVDFLPHHFLPERVWRFMLTNVSGRADGG